MKESPVRRKERDISPGEGAWTLLCDLSSFFIFPVIHFGAKISLVMVK